MINIAWLKIGTITHYYDKIEVGVVQLDNGNLSVGDKIKIRDDETEFTQEVESLQVQHNKVTTIQKGDDAGLKLKQKVRPGAEILVERT